MGDFMAEVDVADCDVLSDVLAFLDDFGETYTDPDYPPSSTSSGAESDSRDSSAGPQSPPSTTSKPRVTPANPGIRPRVRVRDKNAARPRRLERYWTKKHEMNKLRDEVAYLSNKLELLRQCARSPAEIKVTSELGVTIRRVCHRRVTNWKRLAAHEREMRERAEHTNAKLREFLYYQRQWTSGMNGEVAQAAGALAKNPQIADESRALVPQPKSSGRKLTPKMHDATWGEILWQLYVEALTFANGGFVARIETFDWMSAPKSDVRSKPLLEWTTSFPVPRSDPRSAGNLWWQAAQQNTASHGSCEDSHGVHDAVIPRMEKTCKWSLRDEEHNREVEATSITVLENRQADGFWIVAITTTAYDASKTAVLFRATVSIAVTKGAVTNAQSCVIRAHYRIHDADAALTPGERLESTSPTDAVVNASDAKLAINNWVNMVRGKDHELQRAFLQA